ncbi:ADP-ribosylation factor 1 [Oopsacas minuta]|uniref:ADP-ribosylation factor 1 n=1 Tax=Oopsacas minuta TaxID=111878 RepID=A0AAV7KQB8_9METZ|nr:ADP-ribosylation factor 1 [Oopsacas minuta]
MGFIISKDKPLPNEKRPHILMLGLDNTGKTTLFNRINSSQSDFISEGPTVGYNVQPIRFRKLSCRLWDVGGKRQIRTLWKHYYQGTDALIYVVDSTDSDRFADAGEEIKRILSHQEMRGVPVLVIANKQDLKTSLKPTDVKRKLDLNGIEGNSILVQGTSAVTGKGVKQGLKHIHKMIRQKRKCDLSQE